METATKVQTQCLVFIQPLSCSTYGNVMEKLAESCSKIMWGLELISVTWLLTFLHEKKKKNPIHIIVTCQEWTISEQFPALCCTLRACLFVPLLTSKQYSCPRMLEWTGLMMASSSSVRSSASAALLGDSRDSWEWDSLKLCIKRVLWGTSCNQNQRRTGSLSYRRRPRATFNVLCSWCDMLENETSSRHF